MRISRALLDSNGGGLRSSLREAARFMAMTTADEFLEDVLSKPERIRAIVSLVAGLDHVGFMATAEAGAVIGPAAREAGFDTGQRTFPSTILSRQLGEIAGRDIVPTKIFKAHGGSANEPRRTVEVAIPHDVEDEIVRGWIRRGIGAHVALRLESPSCFPNLRCLMEEEGFRMPTFMNGEPLTNPADGITTVFFDRRPAKPLGLEFCHYE